MSWIELTDKRGRGSKVFQASSDVARHSLDSQCATAWHYGSDMAEVDLTPDRVLAGGHDGWRVTQNGWHYFLGQPNGLPDGFVGFGGRQGERWLLFRLLRVGYIHWPTRAWDDIGSAPDYDRANLSQESHSVEIPTSGESIPVETVATWSDLWNTAGGGALDASWKIDGNRLKEEITINQAARTWIAANRPPATAPDETYFSFVFRLGSAPDVNNIEMDLSYLPRWLKNGVLQDTEGDFDDDDGTVGIEVQNALQEFLFFLPISEAYVKGAPPTENIKLRKRIYKDGADYYLLVGAKITDLVGLPAGDLVFDPSVEDQVGTGTEDAYWSATLYGGGYWATAEEALVGGGDDGHLLSRHTVATIANGDTVNADTYLRRWCMYANNGPNTRTQAQDVDDADTLPTNATEADGLTLTTAYTDYNIPDLEGDTSFDVTVQTTIAEIVARGGWSAGNDVIMVCKDIDTTPEMVTYVYEGNSSYAPLLHVDYTAAAAPSGMEMAIASRHMATLRGE